MSYRGLAENLKMIAQDLVRLEELKVENERLRRALREIASRDTGRLDAMVAWDMKHEALAALGEKSRDQRC